jgi:dTDP-4-dehydrorhamnose 3,5-epimerase
MPFEFNVARLPGLILVVPSVFPDDRGFFLESYKYSEFAAGGIEGQFVQDNHSFSTQGVLRGLHYQKPPCAQGKLIRVLSGKICDVSVDIRRGSPFFGQWEGFELSDENRHMLWVPPGFAHGFYVISERADVTYKTTTEYSRENERGIIWNDPDIGIQWPDKSPILSDADQKHPRLADCDADFPSGEESF